MQKFLFLITRGLIVDIVKPFLSYVFLHRLAVCAFLFSCFPKIEPEIHSFHFPIMDAIFKI